jgi:amino acid permease
MSVVIASGSSVAIIFYIIVGVFAYATFSLNEEKLS